MLRLIHEAVCTSCGETWREAIEQKPERGRGSPRRALFRCPAGWRERGLGKDGKRARSLRDVEELVHYCPDCRAPDEEEGS